MVSGHRISISIHLMLMLIIHNKLENRRKKAISIHLMLMLIQKNVVDKVEQGNFNTSHVNVNHLMLQSSQLNFINFNTSHVNVNQIICCIFSIITFISIHLMLMLITATYSINKVVVHFNTSHVNVNPMNLSLFQSRLNLSLPILSHFSKNYQPISLFLTMGLISLLPQVFTGLLEIFFINCLVNTSII